MNSDEGAGGQGREREVGGRRRIGCVQLSKRAAAVMTFMTMRGREGEQGVAAGVPVAPKSCSKWPLGEAIRGQQGKPGKASTVSSPQRPKSKHKKT